MDYLKQEIRRLDQLLKNAQESLNDPQLKSLALEEIEKLKSQKKSLLDSQKQSLNKKKQTEENKTFKSIVLEIRAAAGGEEAKIWADNLLEMYLHFAVNQNLEATLIDQGILKIKGKKAYPLYKYEAGVHRVQRIPETESHGRIHTSTASVAVLPEVEEKEIQINPNQIEVQFYRASSQGGQNVQKVSTAVRITHKPTGIITTCQTQRYQEQNRKIAIDLLRSKLFQIQQEEKENRIGKARQVIGRGMRAEKIRTYNFPQNRVTDHRIKKSWKNLDNILEGDLLPIIKQLNASQ